jgi:hypothetical protein
MYGVNGFASAHPAYTGVSYAGYFENAVPSGTNAYGLYGYAHGLTNAFSSFGIYGWSQSPGSGSNFGAYLLSDSTGTGTSYGARTIGLSRGMSTAYGITGIAANRSTGTVYGGYFEAFNLGTGTKYGVYGKAPSTGYAGYFEGNIRVTGNQTVLGTKSAAVEVEPADYRLVYSQESPECWFEDFGEGQLVNGRAHIELDPLFLKTVTVDQQNQMKVFIQLNDPDCNGTAVIRGTQGFDVVELMNGKGSASFTYRVVAKRRGYESVRLAPMSGETPEQIAAQQEADRATLHASEAAMEQDRIQQQEQKLKRTLEDKQLWDHTVKK